MTREISFAQNSAQSISRMSDNNPFYQKPTVESQTDLNREQPKLVKTVSK